MELIVEVEAVANSNGPLSKPSNLRSHSGIYFNVRLFDARRLIPGSTSSHLGGLSETYYTVV
jgi:hypothetical protein